MDLARLEFTLRPRSPWEAIDLGFSLARRWFVPLATLWLITALPVTLLFSLYFYDSPVALSFILWWCKPLFEPLLLFWLSRAVFGEQIPIKTVTRDWWRINRSGLLPNLTIRRLSPSRSFTMPVWLLEGLKGKARGKRINVLGRNQQAGGWLTVVGIHFETILEIGFLLTILTLIPEQLNWIDMEKLFLTPGLLEELLWLGSWILGMVIIAPFYVAAGFSLYLHRRSELEGWDIEINFRRTVEKLAPRRRERSAGIAVVLLAVAALFATPQQATAEAPGPQQSKQLIEQVLAEPPFGRLEQQGYWKFVGERKEEEGKDDGSWVKPLIKVIKVAIEVVAGFFKGTASLLEIALWAVGFGIVAYLLYHLSHNAAWMQHIIGPRREKRRELPTELFGLDLRADSLPDDIAAAALQMLHDSKLRQALSLLYRGSLIRLITEHQIDIPGSATEGECLRLVAQQRGASEADFFASLTQLWLVTAYAHRLPEPQQIERLCHRWQQVYGHGEQ